MKKCILELATASLFTIVCPAWADDSVPANLPFGNNALQWIITNGPCSMGILMETTNANGSQNISVPLNQITGSFASYGDFVTCVVSNASRFYSYVDTSSGAHVRYVVNLQTSSGLLLSDVDLGSATNINANSFYRLNFTTTNSFDLPIDGVASASVQFGNDISNSVPVVNGSIVLNNSFITNSGRMRLTITLSSGATATYTQGGNLILPPSVSIYSWNDWYRTYGQFSIYPYLNGFPNMNTNSLFIFVTSSAGSDTVIQSTTNFVAQSTTNLVPWNIEGSIPWNSIWNRMVMQVPADNPMKFYRSVSD